MPKPHLIITGGHITPAYAFAEYAIRHGFSLTMIGTKHHTSLEAREITSLGINYESINTVKFDRYHKIRSFCQFPQLYTSIIQSLRLLVRYRPVCVFSFGGYVSIPVGLAAYWQKIPLVIHEQTHSAGLANRFLGLFASTIALSYPESIKYFPSSKTIVTGNLIRHDIWCPPHTNPLKLPTSKPILFITGGNQGSKAILSNVLPIINLLADKYQIVIQTGMIELQCDNLLPDIVLKPWFSAQEISWILHHSHLVVCRGGANTTSEIMVAGVPSIIVPLKMASHNEQEENARSIVDSQAGIILPQDILSPGSIEAAIKHLELNYDTYSLHARKLKMSQKSDAPYLLLRAKFPSHSYE